MLSIVPVPEEPSPLHAHAQTLFRLYGEFLRATQSCSGFVNFAKYDEETRTLPTPYTAHGGELLLALSDDLPAACIAYRDAPVTRPGDLAANQEKTVEIKRLFVHPDFRGQGVARLLTEQALTHVTARGYTRAILDTDTVAMPAAVVLYTAIGFREYAPRLGKIAFLTRPLPNRPMP